MNRRDAREAAPLHAQTRECRGIGKAAASAVAVAAGIFLASLSVPVGLQSAASADRTTQVPLDQVVLGANQIRPGYTARVFPHGRQLQGHPTFDLCGHHFRSDNMRSARLDVGYSKVGSATRVENEVVAYRQGGSALALREARQLPKVCPAISRKATKPTEVTGFRVRRLWLRHLPKGALSLGLTIHERISNRPLVVHVLIVIQARDDLLSVLAVTPRDNRASRALARHVARQSALNLQRASIPPHPSYPPCAQQVSLTLTPAEGPSPTPATLSFSAPTEQWDGFYLYEGTSVVWDGGGYPPISWSVVMRGSTGTEVVFTLVRAYTNNGTIEPTCTAGTATFTITK